MTRAHSRDYARHANTRGASFKGAFTDDQGEPRSWQYVLVWTAIIMGSIGGIYAWV